MKRAVAAVVLSLVIAGVPALAAAQGRYVRLDGSVQWIAADKMQLILDSGRSIAVDLTRVPQEQYRALRQRDRVSVTGLVAADSRTMLATSVIRVDWWGPEAP